MSINIEILENFLSEEDLIELQSLELKYTGEKEMNVYVQKIEKDKIDGSGISKDTVIRLHKNYHTKALAILSKLNVEKTNLYDYSEFGITDTGANYNFQMLMNPKI